MRPGHAQGAGSAAVRAPALAFPAKAKCRPGALAHPTDAHPTPRRPAPRPTRSTHLAPLAPPSRPPPAPPLPSLRGLQDAAALGCALSLLRDRRLAETSPAERTYARHPPRVLTHPSCAVRSMRTGAACPRPGAGRWSPLLGFGSGCQRKAPR